MKLIQCKIDLGTVYGNHTQVQDVLPVLKDSTENSVKKKQHVVSRLWCHYSISKAADEKKQLREMVYSSQLTNSEVAWWFLPLCTHAQTTVSVSVTQILACLI